MKQERIVINEAVRLREGISLALEVVGASFNATLILSKSGTLRQISTGKLSLAEAFRQAETVSLEHGFSGYYDINEPDHWPAATFTEYGQAGDEIKRQLDLVRPRGASFGGGTIDSVGAMTAAREHLARLDPFMTRFYGLATGTHRT